MENRPSIAAQDVANAIHRHVNTVLDWAKKGLIPSRRRNARVILFVFEDVLAAMAKNGLNFGSENPGKDKEELRRQYADGKSYLQTARGKAALANARHNRRARQLAVASSASTEDVEAFLNSAIFCFYCLKPFTGTLRPTLDHFIPFGLGGAHSLENFVAACASCNSLKSDKHPLVFLRAIGKK